MSRRYNEINSVLEAILFIKLPFFESPFTAPENSPTGTNPSSNSISKDGGEMSKTSKLIREGAIDLSGSRRQGIK